MTQPNFRALCAELVNELHGYKALHPEHGTDLIDLACQGLATPPPEPPSEEDLLRLWQFNFGKTPKDRFMDIAHFVLALATPPPEPKEMGDAIAHQAYVAFVQICKGGSDDAGTYEEDEALVRCALKRLDTLESARAALATPPPEPPTIGNVEDVARVIYSDAMTWAAANVPGGAIPPWVDGGNSTAQDVARQVARSLAIPPPEPPTDEELVTFLYVIDPEDELSPLAMARAALERWGNG